MEIAPRYKNALFLFKAGNSGWTDPLPLDSVAAASTGEASSKPVLVRAAIPEWGSVHEFVARLNLVGSGFERTLVSHLGCLGAIRRAWVKSHCNRIKTSREKDSQLLSTPILLNYGL